MKFNKINTRIHEIVYSRYACHNLHNGNSICYIKFRELDNIIWRRIGVEIFWNISYYEI